MQCQIQDSVFPNLTGHNYMNLTTYRKSGAEVTTPVWFAEHQERLYVVTDAQSGKAKRLRNRTDVKVGPCTARGESLGPTVPALARILPVGEAIALPPLRAKYGWQLRFFQLMWWFRRTQEVFLEIEAVDGAPGGDSETQTA
jgi:PPOX class probable F420-dependent enzyme